MLYTMSESSVGFVLCAAVLQWLPFRDLRLASQPGGKSDYIPYNVVQHAYRFLRRRRTTASVKAGRTCTIRYTCTYIHLHQLLILA